MSRSARPFPIRPSENAISVVADGLYYFPSTSPTKFYVIGGLGEYGLGGKVETSAGDVSVDRQWKFGLNGGVGAQFGLSGFSTFVEARFHTVFAEGSNANFIPITVGVNF